MANFKIDPDQHSTFGKSLRSMLFLSAPAVVALAITITGFLFLGSVTPSCTPVERQGARTVIDLAGAACQLLDHQDEETWVKLICAVVEGPGQVVKTVILRVPRNRIAVNKDGSIALNKDGSIAFIPASSASTAASNTVIPVAASAKP